MAEQPRDEMHGKIKRASRRKLLRRQMDLITEYNRTNGQRRIPEGSLAMVQVHKELVKADRIFAVRVLVAALGVACLVKRLVVKLTERVD